MWIERGRHAFGIANFGARCKEWIDAQLRGCDTSSEGRMGVRGENKQADLYRDWQHHEADNVQEYTRE